MRLVAVESCRPVRIRLTIGRVFKVVDPHDVSVGRSSLRVPGVVDDHEPSSDRQQACCVVELVSLLDVQPSAEVR